MNSKIGILLLILAALGLLIAGGPFFVVNEYELAIITQFGKPIGGPYALSGLYFKVPFIQKVTYFEKRILEWDGYPTQIPTKDKKYIWVDTTARWRIVDALKFFQSVSDERGAQARLDDIVDSAVRDSVTANNLFEIVRDSNRLLEEAVVVDADFVAAEALERVTKGRELIRQDILKQAKVLGPQYGIELLDLRIKRVNYVEEVRAKVYDRMISERKRAAEQYRSEGKGKRAEIQGQTEKELKQILSAAYKDAQKIKGEADNKATKIYADAYNQDPEFFSFLKSLEAYADSIGEDSLLILTTDAEYFKYLQRSKSQ
jgi:membrane protease subunit HflC